MDKMILTGLNLLLSGKVRDVYELGNKLLIVASDRISAFDYILPTPIPNKGKILNQISIFWFDYLSDIVPNHFITDDVEKFPPEAAVYKEELRGRTMLVRKAKRIDVECVVRGYLAGSGWKEYTQTGSVCGEKLPAGLKESDKLPEPIFTPATKMQMGSHDENISFRILVETVGKNTANTLREKSIAIYKKAADFALKKGIIIADTKFEFGIYNKNIILIDEALTPDSSRFWDVEKYKPGISQDSFDKQYVRDYLESIKWDKEPPIPELPADVVNGTFEKYAQAYERLTGQKFIP